MVDACSEAVGDEDWALAGGVVWVRGKGISRSSMLGEGLEKLDLQRDNKRAGRPHWYDR